MEVHQMKKLFLILSLLASCGGTGELSKKEPVLPFIVQTTPDDGDGLLDDTPLTIQFSENMNPETLGEDSIIVVDSSSTFSEEEKLADELLKKWKDEELQALKGRFFYDTDKNELIWTPEKIEPATEKISVLIRRTVQSKKHFPILNRLKSKEVAYIFTFSLNSPHNTSFPESDTQGGTADIMTVSPLTDWKSEKTVILTEAVTDPQHDWNDTFGGDKLAFNTNYGSGTISISDEYVELYNLSENVIDMSKWKLLMNDGTDETEFFSNSTAVFNFSKGGNLSHFLPKETLVIGNPKGDMKNSIFIHLLDESDNLVDEVNIPNSDATNFDDESFSRSEENQWIQAPASLLKTEFD